MHSCLASNPKVARRDEARVDVAGERPLWGLSTIAATSRSTRVFQSYSAPGGFPSLADGEPVATGGQRRGDGQEKLVGLLERGAVAVGDPPSATPPQM